MALIQIQSGAKILNRKIFCTIVLMLSACKYADEPLSNDYEVRFQVTQNYRVDKGLQLQGVPGAIAAVPDPLAPQQLALRIRASKYENYSSVVNGAPRAEMVFEKVAPIKNGIDYLISWEMLLPRAYEFDFKQGEILAQIHQGKSAGNPPLAILLEGSRYIIGLRGGAEPQQVERSEIGNASADRGRWVKWDLHYIPDDMGERSMVEVLKDGELIFQSTGANAYPADRKAYLKLGVYKWAWTSSPSDVTEREIYFRNITIANRINLPRR